MKLDKLTFASDLSGGFIGTQNLNCECADSWQLADGRWQMADGRWQMADTDKIKAKISRYKHKRLPSMSSVQWKRALSL
jgi:hypothetical protein